MRSNRFIYPAALFCVATLNLIYPANSPAAPSATQSPTADASALHWVDVKLPGLPPGATMALIEGDLRQPGRIVFRLALPAHFVFPPHYHDTDEQLRILSGKVYMSMAAHDGGEMPSVAGSVHAIPAHSVHSAHTADDAATLEVVTSGPYAIHWVDPR